MNPAQSQALTWREAPVAIAALAAVAAVVRLVDGSVAGLLFTRPLWVDEMHTALLAERTSPIAVIRDLAAGVDFGPPLMPLAAWVLRHVLGSLGPTALRAAALACALATIAVVYLVLRRRFSAAASGAGAAAVAVHQLFIEHAFEGRFYAPWLLCSALFAWSLGDSAGARASRWRLAAASVALSTVHWYGVIALVCMSLGVVLAAGPHWRNAVARLRPALAGLIALGACVPLAVGQRRALTVSTWVADFTPAQLVAVGSSFWTATVPAACAALLAAALAWRARNKRPMDPVLRPVADAPVAALFALIAMPLALAALSVIGQPSMIGRYAIVAGLAWAPLAALSAEAVGRWPARALGLWFLSLTVRGLLREVERKKVFAVGVRADASAFTNARSVGLPVVFQSMHTLYAVAGVDAAHRDAMVFLDVPDSTLAALFSEDTRFYQLNKGLRVERDVIRVHARRFGFPRLASQRALDTTSRFVLLANDLALPRGYVGVEALGRALFPGHRAVPLAPSVTLFERIPMAGKVPSRLQNAPPSEPNAMAGGRR